MPSNPDQARKLLELRLGPIRELIEDLEPDDKSWIRTIRSAMEMPARVLAKWMRMGQQSVAELEKRERDGRITVASLRKAADALDCTFVYAFIPNRPLDVTMDRLIQKLGEQVPAEHRDSVAEMFKNNPASMWRLL